MALAVGYIKLIIDLFYLMTRRISIQKKKTPSKERSMLREEVEKAIRLLSSPKFSIDALPVK
jgi:hypothetical protein